MIKLKGVTLIDESPVEGIDKSRNKRIVQKLALGSPDFRVYGRYNHNGVSLSPMLWQHDPNFSSIGNVFVDSCRIENSNGVNCLKADIEIFPDNFLYERLVENPQALNAISLTHVPTKKNVSYKDGKEVWEIYELMIQEVSSVGNGNYTSAYVTGEMIANACTASCEFISISNSASNTNENAILYHNPNYGISNNAIMEEEKDTGQVEANSPEDKKEEKSEGYESKGSSEMSNSENSENMEENNMQSSSPVSEQAPPNIAQMLGSASPEEQSLISMFKSLGISVQDLMMLMETKNQGLLGIMQAIGVQLKYPNGVPEELITGLRKMLGGQNANQTQEQPKMQDTQETNENSEKQEENTPKQVIIEEKPMDNKVTAELLGKEGISNSAVSQANVKVVPKTLTAKDLQEISQSSELRKQGGISSMVENFGLEEHLNNEARKVGFTENFNELASSSISELQEKGYTKRQIGHLATLLTKPVEMANSVISNSAMSNMSVTDPRARIKGVGTPTTTGIFETFGIKERTIEDYVFQELGEDFFVNALRYSGESQDVQAIKDSYLKYVNGQGWAKTFRESYIAYTGEAVVTGPGQVPDNTAINSAFSLISSVTKLGAGASITVEERYQDIHGIAQQIISSTDHYFDKAYETWALALLSSDAGKWGSGLVNPLTNDYLKARLLRADAFPYQFRRTSIIGAGGSDYYNRPLFLKQSDLTPELIAQGETPNHIVDNSINFATDPLTAAKKIYDYIMQLSSGRRYPFLGKEFASQVFPSFLAGGQKIKVVIPRQGYHMFPFIKQDLFGGEFGDILKHLFANPSVVSDYSQAKTNAILSEMIEVVHPDANTEYQEFASLFTNDIFIIAPVVSLGNDKRGGTINIDTIAKLKSSIYSDYTVEIKDGAGTEQINTYRYGSLAFQNPSAIMKITCGNTFFTPLEHFKSKP
jgi:hypothetical protein